MQHTCNEESQQQIGSHLADHVQKRQQETVHACLTVGLFQLLQCAAKLVGTGRSLHATADAVELADDIIYPLSPHKLADSLKITIAPALEIHVLDDVVLVGRHFNRL